MLLHKEKSCLIIIDVQEKLTPYIQQVDSLITHCQWLMRLASELDIPLLVTEQYRQGLGPTIEPLRQLMPGKTDIDKLYFSCYRDPSFQKHWQIINKRQAVLAGIETHVCVLQTAMDLLAAGTEVFIVVDAVGSRHELDHRYGLKRLKQAGAQLVTKEMVFFEWMEQAGKPAFKALSKVFIPPAHKTDSERGL
ncbi:MAG TPA: hydrolase [Legionellaceae bacterium]|nr:hydrolase [Legionellaceae bacterium]